MAELTEIVKKYDCGSNFIMDYIKIRDEILNINYKTQDNESISSIINEGLNEAIGEIKKRLESKFD